MANILSARSMEDIPQQSDTPIAFEAHDVKGISAESLQAIITTFVNRWQGTHAVNAPSYIIGSQGEQRVVLQAIDRTLWLKQQEESGIAQARAQVAMAIEAQALSNEKKPLITGVAMPVPNPPQQGRGGIPGAFGRGR